MTPTPSTQDELLTSAQAAQVLNVPVGTLRYWRHAGTGPKSFAIGKRTVRYRRGDLDNWLTNRMATTGKGGL